MQRAWTVGLVKLALMGGAWLMPWLAAASGATTSDDISVVISSPRETVKMPVGQYELLLEAELDFPDRVAGESTPEIEWHVSPSASAMLRAVDDGHVAVAFAQAGTYAVWAEIESNGTVYRGTRTVVIGERTFSGNLRAEWLFDGDGATVPDTSGNGLNGALSSGLTREPGVTGTAFTGNGGEASRVTVADFPHLEDFTVSAWVRADSLVQRLPRIIETPEWVLLLELEGGSTRQTLKFARKKEPRASAIWNSPTGTITTGRWYHVAASWGEGDDAPALYINGAAVPVIQSAAPVGDAINSSGTAYLGNNADGTRGLDGRLDEVRVFDRVLSDREVALLAAHPAPQLETTVATAVEVGQRWEPTATVADFGGVQGLHWEVLNGPGEVEVTGAQTRRPSFVFDAAGVYTVALTVEGSEASVRQSWQVSTERVYRVSMTTDHDEVLLCGGNVFPVNVLVESQPDESLEINYRIGGDAEAGVDFVALPGRFNLDAGEGVGGIDVTALTRREGDEHVLTVTLEPGAGYVLDGRTEATVTLVPYSYANWKTHYAQRFSADNGGWEPLGDADGDGQTNLMKYALGGRPGESLSGRLPRLIAQDGVLSLRYVRPEGADKSQYLVGSGARPDRDGIRPVPAGEQVVSNGDGTETVTVTDTRPLEPGEIRFLWLRVQE